MLWITRRYVHFDRVASAWLIKRFVDPDATFAFVEWQREDVAPPGASPFAIPGAALGPHDRDGTTFLKILRHYELETPALSRLARAIELGIESVVAAFRPPPDDTDGQIGIGLVNIAEGMVVALRDDQSILDASFPVYDALYAHFRTSEAMLTSGDHDQIDVTDPRGPGPLIEKRRAIFDGLR